LFYLSIVFISNTERASVVDANYVDWINSDVKYIDLNSGSSSEKYLIENKPYFNKRYFSILFGF